MEKRMENLIEESKRIVELLQQNFHPHTTVIIEADSIRVEETIAAELIQYDVNWSSNPNQLVEELQEVAILEVSLTLYFKW